MGLYNFHYYLQYLIEFVGRKALNVLGASIEVSPEVGENSEVGVDRGCISFEDFKVSVTGWQTEPNTFIVGDDVVENGLDS